MTETVAQSVDTRSYEHFVESLRDSDLPPSVVSPQRFGEALNIDLQTLASHASVHRNTVARAPASRGVQDFLRESLRVIKAAADVSGDIRKALFWYRNEPLGPFGYKTPERLVSEGRADDVIRYLESVEAGAAG